MVGVKNKKNSQEGFTLIELILYVSIVSIITTSLILFGVKIVEENNKNRTEQEVYAAARYLSERIKYEIHNANSINIASSDFDLNLATNPWKKLSLAQTAPNDPTIIDVSGGKARITQGAGSALNLNSTETTVTNLTFTNYTSGDGKTENVALALTVNSSLVGSHEYTESVTVRSTAEVRSN